MSDPPFVTIMGAVISFIGPVSLKLCERVPMCRSNGTSALTVDLVPFSTQGEWWIKTCREVDSYL